MAALRRSAAAGAAATLGLSMLGAVTAPATAGPDHGERTGLSLTRSAALTLDRYDVDVDLIRERKAYREASNRHRVHGTVAFDGNGPSTRWSAIRVNERTNRVTAVVNGTERLPVLAFKDVRHSPERRGWGEHRGTVYRLTPAGARSIDRAAAADAFDAGDRFLTSSRRHR